MKDDDINWRGFVPAFWAFIIVLVVLYFLTWIWPVID